MVPVPQPAAPPAREPDVEPQPSREPQPARR
jgi:hypothetical protein